MRKIGYSNFRFDFPQKLRSIILLIGLCYMNSINSQVIDCLALKSEKKQTALGYYTNSNDFSSKSFNLDYSNYDSKYLNKTVFVDFKTNDENSKLLKSALLISGIGFCIFGFVELGKAYSPGSGQQSVGDPNVLFLTGLVSGGIGTGLIIWSCKIK